MFDPLLKHLAAKAKAVGLIAGTAMVTTALVGGGAVALTTVSNDGELVEDAAVVATASPSADADALLALSDVVAAATPTVGIEEPDEDEDEGEDAGKVRPPLPADFTCDDTKNHGQNVSAYAKSLPKGPGRGEKVSAVAQSDCGKKAGDAEELATTEAEEADEVESEEAEEAEEPKPAKAEKPAKANKSGKSGASKSSKGKGGGKKG